MICSRADSVLIVVDLQDSFLAPIAERDSIVARSKFLIEVARLLGVPIVVTEQYTTRMGGTTQAVLDSLGDSRRFDKMCFSGCRNVAFWSSLEALEKNQAILVGIETHICMNQTAHDLLEEGYEVFVCEDATGCRPAGAHEGALKRLRHEGAVVGHTESVAYEWLGEAGTDEFREALMIVKRYGAV